MAAEQPDAGYPLTDIRLETPSASQSGATTPRSLLPHSPQEVRDISAQEDTAEVPDPEPFTNVGASVGQTTQHAQSFTSSLGLGCASGEPAPDFPRFALHPDNEHIQLGSTTSNGQSHGEHINLLRSFTGTQRGACRHLYECRWAPTVGSRKADASNILVVGRVHTKNVHYPC